MPRNYYELGGSCVGPAAGCPFLNFYTAASTDAAIVELAIFNRAAASSLPSLVRTSTVGVTTTSFLGMSLDPYNPSASAATRVGTAWSTVPASAANPLRQLVIPATIGNGVIFSWPSDAPLEIAACSGISINHAGPNSASPMNFYIKWTE